MNASRRSLVVRKRSAPTGAACAVFVLVALFAAAPASAEVRVGVSLGFELPHGHVEVRVGPDRYYEHRGVFYQHGPRGYLVVRAPRGAIVRRLPPYYTRIYVGNVMYYRYGDAYYRPARDGYVVVDPPAVTSLPPVKPVEQYQSVWVGEKEYLFRNGQFFSKTPEGMVWVPAPIGAITKDLPADAQSIWYEEVEYFESDEVYFRKSPDGYRVVTAPWKK